MDWWERVALVLGSAMSHYLPNRGRAAHRDARLRQETRAVILPGEEGDLRRYLQPSGARTACASTSTNWARRSWARAEAGRRMQAYLALLARDDVEYISVKVSSVFSQLNLVAFDATREHVKERLRALYRQASPITTAPRWPRHPQIRESGHGSVPDLHLTVRRLPGGAGRAGVLDAERWDCPAGLPARCLRHPAGAHHLGHGALCAAAVCPIKIRIVKGANLAMEQVEASLHGWPQAPYPTKLETDANFKRMVAYGSQPDMRRLYGWAWPAITSSTWPTACCCAHQHGVEEAVEFEMLEGMANHQARAVQREAGGLLLYAPVVKTEDFHSAIAYLVRRLDENTAPENFLHDLFSMEPDSDAWQRQRDRFLAACQMQDEVRPTDHAAPRIAAREQPVAHHRQPFDNEPDTDWSLPANQAWIKVGDRALAGDVTGAHPAADRRRVIVHSPAGHAGRSFASAPGSLPLCPRRLRPGGSGAGRGPGGAAGVGLALHS